MKRRIDFLPRFTNGIITFPFFRKWRVVTDVSRCFLRLFLLPRIGFCWCPFFRRHNRIFTCCHNNNPFLLFQKPCALRYGGTCKRFSPCAFFSTLTHSPISYLKRWWKMSTNSIFSAVSMSGKDLKVLNNSFCVIE